MFVVLLLTSACEDKPSPAVLEKPTSPYLVVLGVAQDAGYPQMGCKKECCSAAWKGERSSRYATSMALVDPISKQKWLFEASPDIKYQLQHLSALTPEIPDLSGVFITHAHIGHYTGLVHFGREAMGAKDLPVYTLPRLSAFLQENGPWSQLVSLNNIALQHTMVNQKVALNEHCWVNAISVPHRDEFSETAGFQIGFGNKTALFIPDIDKWEKWELNIAEEIQRVDYAFLDATFFDGNELPGRDMSQIPHPFVKESLELFKGLSSNERAKVHFIHFNHTNPLLNEKSDEMKQVMESGFKVAKEGMIVK